MADSQEILSLPIDDVLAQLKTSQSGLSSEQVQNRLSTYGPNEFAKKRARKNLVDQNIQRTMWIAGDEYVNVLNLNILLIQRYPSIYKAYS